MLRTKTQEYLNSDEVQKSLSGSARFLVNKRQAQSRQSDQDHWERYCYGVWDYCCIEPCNDHGKKYFERRTLQRHIQEMHPGCSDVERWLDEDRRFRIDRARMIFTMRSRNLAFSWPYGQGANIRCSLCPSQHWDRKRYWRS